MANARARTKVIDAAKVEPAPWFSGAPDGPDGFPVALALWLADPLVPLTVPLVNPAVGQSNA